MQLCLEADHPQSPTDEEFSRLHREHANAVHHLILRIVRNPADAEDVSQQAFAQAWSQLSQFDPSRGQIGAWLMCIARARALDFLRANRRRADLGRAGTAGAAREPAIEDALEFRAQQQRLRGLMCDLPDATRRVLQLMYDEGLTQQQAATLLQKPLGTVKTLARRALGSLRARCGEAVHPRANLRASRTEPELAEIALTTELFDERAVSSGRRRGPRCESLKNVHVVVVDDDGYTRDLLARVVRGAGGQCTLCPSATEAITLLEVVLPDVLVADITMPGEDGYALIRRVRALVKERNAHLPSLAFTARGREDERARALLAGFTAHLGKPVHPTAVVSAVAALAVRRT